MATTKKSSNTATVLAKLIDEFAIENDIAKEATKNATKFRKEIKEIIEEKPGVIEGKKYQITLSKKSRNSLNKDLLLENGVPLKVIEASMKETEYFEWSVNKK